MTLELLERAAVRVVIDAGQRIRNPRIVDALLKAGTRCAIVPAEANESAANGERAT